ncbi:hypothetical protein H6F86_23580 [Phormidium sp. FACHB-592]|nr:hypothetical protein [Phormidium sp. FACHB-592]
MCRRSLELDWSWLNSVAHQTGVRQGHGQEPGRQRDSDGEPSYQRSHLGAQRRTPSGAKAMGDLAKTTLQRSACSLE